MKTKDDKSKMSKIPTQEVIYMCTKADGQMCGIGLNIDQLNREEDEIYTSVAENRKQLNNISGKVDAIYEYMQIVGKFPGSQHSDSTYHRTTNQSTANEAGPLWSIVSDIDKLKSKVDGIGGSVHAILENVKRLGEYPTSQQYSGATCSSATVPISSCERQIFGIVSDIDHIKRKVDGILENKPRVHESPAPLQYSEATNDSTTFLSTKGEELLCGIDLKGESQSAQQFIDANSSSTANICNSCEELMCGIDLTDDSKSAQQFIDANSSSTANIYNSCEEDEQMRHSDYLTRCMSDAIQCNIEHIIYGIPFDTVQDEVVQKNLVTMEESHHICELPYDHARMRFLVTNIIDKNFEFMSKFSDLIGQCDPDIKARIQNEFQTRINGGGIRQQDECTTCLIQRRVNMTFIADPLFAKRIIGRELYKEITDHMALACKSHLWLRLFQTVSQFTREAEAKLLKYALSHGGEISYYDDIVRHIDRDFARNRSSCTCRCNRKNTACRLCNSYLSTHSETSSSMEPHTLGESSSTVPAASCLVNEEQEINISKTEESNPGNDAARNENSGKDIATRMCTANTMMNEYKRQGAIPKYSNNRQINPQNYKSSKIGTSKAKCRTETHPKYIKSATQIAIAIATPSESSLVKNQYNDRRPNVTSILKKGKPPGIWNEDKSRGEGIDLEIQCTNEITYNHSNEIAYNHSNAIFVEPDDIDIPGKYVTTSQSMCFLDHANNRIAIQRKKKQMCNKCRKRPPKRDSLHKHGYRKRKCERREENKNEEVVHLSIEETTKDDHIGISFD